MKKLFGKRALRWVSAIVFSVVCAVVEQVLMDKEVAERVANKEL